MYDLIIIGGGPSGTSAGREAGKRGLSTLLLEKERFPRYKPCGGGLSPYALSCLDFKLPEALIERKFSKVKVHFQDRFVEGKKDINLASLVSRKLFDNFLLEKARETGIEIHTGERVLDCVDKEGSVEVITADNTYLGSFVLIAEGAGGILKYKVRARDQRTDYSLALVSEVPVSEDTVKEGISDALDFYFGITQGGYGWIFPHSGYYSIGISGVARDFRHPKDIFQGFLKKYGFSEKYPVHSHIIPIGGITRKIINSRILLSGDAAGFADAFLGEGIAYAIRSGQLAAEAVAGTVMYDRKIRNLKKYESACKKEFGSYLTSSYKLNKIMHRFPEITFKLAIDNKEILDKYLDEAIVNRNHKEYVRWLLLNFCLSEPISKIKALAIDGIHRN